MEISLHEAASTPTQDVAEQLQRVPLEYLGDSHESATILKTEPVSCINSYNFMINL